MRPPRRQRLGLLRRGVRDRGAAERDAGDQPRHPRRLRVPAADRRQLERHQGQGGRLDGVVRGEEKLPASLSRLREAKVK